MSLISIVVPVYGCDACLPELHERVKTTLAKMGCEFELILVDDCGPGKPFAIFQKLSKIDSRVKGIRLSRNFGQHYAIHAGLSAAKGEWVVVMDCDLQDQPEEIEKLFIEAQKGFDLVLAKRAERKDSYFKRKFSSLFYGLLGYLTETKQDSSIANFGIYHKKVIKAILSMGDSIRYFPAMVRWVGFHSSAIAIDHAERTEGKTSYNFKRLFKLALDTILSFSDRPLRLTVKLGLFISGFSFLAGIIEIFRYVFGLITEPGYASLILSIWFFSGIIIFVLGIIGLYLGKVFDRVKERPVFIVNQTVGFEHD
jgi:dolichol-phosphate mannosyltransferase